jgi:hypothetical protein
MALIKVVDGEDYLNIKLWMRRASDGGWLRGQKYDLLYQYRYVGMTETDARVQAAADRCHNVLKYIEGVGCEIIKPVDAEGKNWIIAIGGRSDIQPPPGWRYPWAASFVDVYRSNSGGIQAISSYAAVEVEYDTTRHLQLADDWGVAGATFSRVSVNVKDTRPMQVLFKVIIYAHNTSSAAAQGLFEFQVKTISVTGTKTIDGARAWAHLYTAPFNSAPGSITDSNGDTATIDPVWPAMATAAQTVTIPVILTPDKDWTEIAPELLPHLRRIYVTAQRIEGTLDAGLWNAQLSIHTL